MSYDLVFWRYSSRDRRDPREVYAQLMDGQVPNDLAPLPIADILSTIIDRHPGAVRQPNGPDREWIVWSADDRGSSFQVEWSDRHVVVACRGLSGDQMNRFLEIAATFGCPLYDPQTSEQFGAASSD